MPANSPSDPQPMLSILIPAYNYADGVRRIVAPLLAENRSDIEILVSDDSSNDEVEVMMQAQGTHAYLRYTRNVPSIGAVNNWNSLHQKAQGSYVILIHHDDFPLSETFASELIAELEKYSWPDTLILSRLTYDIAGDRIKLGICNYFRSIIGRHFPSYLFLRNVIGPPSVLVVRRDLFKGYDPALKWLVDVEAYFRFLTTQTRRVAFSHLMMATSYGLPNGISTTLRGQEKGIANTELAHLEAKYPDSRFLRHIRGTDVAGKLQSALEWPLWGTVRTISSVCNLLMPTASLSIAVSHRAHFTGSVTLKEKSVGSWIPPTF